MNFFFKWKLKGFEAKLKTAKRVSYYTEEAGAIRRLGHLTRAYQDKDYKGAVAIGYELVTKYNDMHTAYFFLARALEQVGENELALRYFFNGMMVGRKALDSFDDGVMDEMLKLAAKMASTDRVRRWFEELARTDGKTKKYLERMIMLGKL